MVMPIVEQRIDLEFGPDIMWREFDVQIAAPAIPASTRLVDRGVYAMYADLARQVGVAEPIVPDRRGGVSGDRYPF